jgi:hypothetical protein
VCVCACVCVCVGEGVERSWPSLALCAKICAEDLRKITHNLNRIIWPPGRDLNPGHVEYDDDTRCTVPQDLMGYERFILLLSVKLLNEAVSPATLLVSNPITGLFPT